MKQIKRLSILLLLMAVNVPGHAGLYWGAGVQTKAVSVCFVGNAVAKRQDRVDEIMEYLAHFENIANIDFVYWGTCPKPIDDPSDTSKDYYFGDIRVVIPDTNVSPYGRIRGRGCPMFLDANGNYNGDNDGGASWSNSPEEQKLNRSCEYNLKLLDNGDQWGKPWLNHTLHEFGHALGLYHEHRRADIPGTCVPTGDISYGYLTQYDPDSVMNYQSTECGIDGNYSHAGFSDYDRLSLHMLYPEDNRYAEHAGTRVIQSGTVLKLHTAWPIQGADSDFVFSSVSWKVNGATVSYEQALNYRVWAPGNYRVDLHYTDFLGRNYSATMQVEVLSQEMYKQRNAGIRAALSTIML
jgi:hypothetical protein